MIVGLEQWLEKNK